MISNYPCINVANLNIVVTVIYIKELAILAWQLIAIVVYKCTA